LNPFSNCGILFVFNQKILVAHHAEHKYLCTVLS
jgi:hypothetical protein